MTSLDLESVEDEELVRLFQQHGSSSPAALDELCRRHHPTVVAWCRRLCGPGDLAEDAAQEVFIRVQRGLASFRGDSRFSTWLYSLTRRTTINFLQRPSTRREDRGNDAVESAVDETAGDLASLEHKELLAKIVTTVDQVLEPAERRVVHLHYSVGMSLRAITELLGLENRSGAKALLVAAQRKIRAHLARERAELDL